MPRLTDPWFEARFYGKIGADSHEFIDSIDGAQGLFLWCPCGYGQLDKDGQQRYPLDLSLNRGRPHGVMVPFANPRNAPPCPPNHGPSSRGDKNVHPRWTMEGTSLEDLTITPSISVGTVECWHGHIKAGEVLGVKDLAPPAIMQALYDSATKPITRFPMHTLEDHHLHGLLEFAHGGIPPKTIIEWIREYGWPVVDKVLPLVISDEFRALSTKEKVEWATSALSAVANQQEIPPLPSHKTAKAKRDDDTSVTGHTRAQLTAMKVEELRDVADKEKIDLTGITLKDDIIKTILKHERSS